MAEGDPDHLRMDSDPVSPRSTIQSNHSSPTSRRGLETCKSRDSKDAFSWMSAEAVTKDLEISDAGSTTAPSLPQSYPLPLILFVCFLSIIGGLVVTVVHYAILFSGCPLGVNGCNSFDPEKERYGFFLVDALSDKMPEDFVYIIMAAIGAFICAQLCVNLPEEMALQISGGGTVQALVAVASGECIPLKVAGLRLITSSIYLGCGGTLGMDGPAIQICTSITTLFGWYLGMRGLQTQSLLASLGFAAGFAASFNAPLAGILFAMEELSHVCPTLSRHMICIILVVSIVATAVSRLFFGNKELFHTEWGDELMEGIGGGSLNRVFGKHMWMLISIPIAVVCSFVGLLMSKMTKRFRCWAIRSQRRLPFTILVILISLLSAGIGSGVYRATGLRGVWGIGYESLRKAFDEYHAISSFWIFALGKMVATSLALAWRAPGDLLEPVLIVGAFLGGSMGGILQETCGDALGHNIMQPCLVFGMVAFFASCFRFSLTPILIVLEVTGVDTYALVLPAALAAFTAVTVSNRLYVPLLQMVMHEDGICLHQLSEDVMVSLSVGVGSFPLERKEQRDPESDESDNDDGHGHRSSGDESDHSTNSWNLRSIVRGVEATMLTLGQNAAPASRSESRSNSAISRESSPHGSVGVEPRLNTLLSTLRAEKLERGSNDRSLSRSHSRTPTHSSGHSSQGTGISLNIPQSESSWSRHARNSPRANTLVPRGHNMLMGVVPCSIGQGISESGSPRSPSQRSPRGHRSPRAPTRKPSVMHNPSACEEVSVQILQGNAKKGAKVVEHSNEPSDSVPSTTMPSSSEQGTCGQKLDTCEKAKVDADGSASPSAKKESQTREKSQKKGKLKKDADISDDEDLVGI